jgi:WD40 repeat protein
MSAPDHTIRIFISSTFRDMHAERDELVTVVFPELRERLDALELDLFDVDLRWGVPQTGIDGERANSWAYCKQWIERAEPFFICLLGQRYGWVPAGVDIRDEADQEAYKGMSITEMEIRHAVLSGKHRRRSFFYIRETEVPRDSTPVDIYATFVDVNEQSRLLALKTTIRETSKRPVRDYTSRWIGERFSDLSKFGEMVLEDLWSGVLRDDRYVSKAVWRAVLGHDPEHDPVYTDEANPIAREVWERIVERAQPMPTDPLDAESAEMATFARTRLRWFQGRQHELRQLRSFTDRPHSATARQVCVVRAIAGGGKSALLAKLAEQTFESRQSVITHFVGATERSADVRSLIERLSAELDRHGVADVEKSDAKQDFESLKAQFASRLASYEGDRQLLLLIDGVNQLADGSDLSWLPRRLGRSVRIVLSCVDDPAAPLDSSDARTIAALERRADTPEWIRLPPLEESDVREIVTAFLIEFCKELDESDKVAIARMEQAKNPLYLLVLLHELRTLGGRESHVQVRDIIYDLSARHPDTVSLFDWMLERLEVFGVEVARYWWTYLSLGRVGMSGRELADLMRRSAFGQDGADAALKIERSVRRYLQRRGAQWDFFHGQLREAVQRRYLTEDLTPFHAQIAEYFESKWNGPDIHALSELPYHLEHGGLTHKLKHTLTDVAFLQAKVSALGPHRLVDDFNNTNDTVLKTVRNALSRSLHILSDTPSLLATHLHNLLYEEHGEGQDVDPLLKSARMQLVGRPWLRLRVGPPIDANRRALIRILSHRHTSVSSIAWSPDGETMACCTNPKGWGISSVAARHLWVWDHRSGRRLALLEVECKAHAWSFENGLFATSGMDGTIRLFDRFGAESGKFAGHSDSTGVRQDRPVDTPIAVLSWAPDGTRLASGNADGTVRVWDLATGRCALLRTEHKDKDSICTLAWSPSGTRVASGAYNGSLSVSDPTTGSSHFLVGHTGVISALAWSPDSSVLASGSLDRGVRIWDSESGHLQTVLDVHRMTVSCLAFSLDGTRFASGSDDGNVRVWDTTNYQCRGSRIEHAHEVNCLAWSPDQTTLASAGEDQTIRVWFTRSDTPDVVLRGHTDSVTALVWSRSGDLLVSASKDGTTRIWERAKFVSADDRDTHTDWVRTVAWSPDGTSFASGSDDKTIRVWDSATLKSRATLELPQFKRQMGPMVNVKWAGDSGMIAAISSDRDQRIARLVLLWRKTGQLIRSLDGHTAEVLAMAWSPKGQVLATGSGDQSVRLWETSTGRCLANVTKHKGLVISLAWTPDGQTLASGDTEGTVNLWGHDLQHLATLRRANGWILGLSWSFDGAFLAAASDRDRTLRIWTIHGTLAAVTRHATETSARQVPDMYNIRNESVTILTANRREWNRLFSNAKSTIVRTYRADKLETMGIRVSWAPTSHALACTSSEDSIYLLNVHGQSAPVLVGHNGRISAVCWSNDGQWCASGGADQTVRIWNPRSGVCRGIAYCSSPVLALRFSVDNQILIAIDDGSAANNRPGLYAFELSNPSAADPAWPQRVRTRSSGPPQRRAHWWDILKTKVSAMVGRRS